MEIFPGTIRHDLAGKESMARTFATKFRSAVRKGYATTENGLIIKGTEACKRGMCLQAWQIVRIIINGVGSQCCHKIGEQPF